MLSIKDLYWFAGLMEGEGWCGLTNHKSRQLRIQLSLVDKDVIDKAHALFGFGVRTERALPSGKTHYEWTVGEQVHAAGLMMTLLPLMGQRRAEQIKAALAEWKSKPPSRKYMTHCQRGHPLSGGNLRIAMDRHYEKRRCRLCERIRSAKCAAKAKGMALNLEWDLH